MVQYKAAVIGLGRIGLTYDLDAKRERPSAHVLAYKLQPEIELVAAADLRAEQNTILQQMAPGVRYYQDMARLLQDQAVDIVSLCTPPAHHLAAIQFILNKYPPKIIFCEKPLVKSTAEATFLLKQLEATECRLVPNLSRRWNSGMQRVKKHILSGKYGELQNIQVRYTRGILNTGAHLFDLLHWWAGPIDTLQVIEKVTTSADYGLEPDSSFTFTFHIGKMITGFATAFDDWQYYLFEVDLYFAWGKIEVRNSGDEVLYYQTGDHHLFSGFKNLYLEHRESGLLAEANLGNAVHQLVGVLKGTERPACTVGDGIYPIYVAEALQRSYRHSGSRERVGYKSE